MNKIEKLLAELCPNGVVYKALGEVCKFQRGRTITAEDAVEGEVPVVAGGQTPAYYHNEANRNGETISISSSGAYAGFVNFWTIPVFLSDSFSVNPNLELLTSKYVFYFLKNIQEQIHNSKKGSGVPHVHGSDLAKFQIPIPPLPIQKKIVNILDKFTKLEARKKQYEYYRNNLMVNDKWLMVSLGEIGEVKMCKRIFKEQTQSIGIIPFYKIGTFGKEPDAYISMELYEEYKNKFSFPKKGDILISASGTIGRTVIYDGEPAYFQDSNIVWIDNDEKHVLNKFLYHYYKIVQWQTDGGGTIARLYNDNLKKTKIPILSIEEQKRIVMILDKFEKLTNDISEGLPAEIKMRKQQYEYYRNKLLTFEKYE